MRVCVSNGYCLLETLRENDCFHALWCTTCIKMHFILRAIKMANWKHNPLTLADNRSQFRGFWTNNQNIATERKRARREKERQKKKELILNLSKFLRVMIVPKGTVSFPLKMTVLVMLSNCMVVWLVILILKNCIEFNPNSFENIDHCTSFCHFCFGFYPVFSAGHTDHSLFHSTHRVNIVWLIKYKNKNRNWNGNNLELY